MEAEDRHTGEEGRRVGRESVGAHVLRKEIPSVRLLKTLRGKTGVTAGKRRRAAQAWSGVPCLPFREELPALYTGCELSAVKALLHPAISLAGIPCRCDRCRVVWVRDCVAPGEGAWVSAADGHSLVWDVSLQPASCDCSRAMSAVPNRVRTLRSIWCVCCVYILLVSGHQDTETTHRY